MGPLAIFGITNDGLNLAVKLLILFLAAIWLALVFWTFADARRRIADPLLVACATAASLFFPFLGTIVYAIVRPPEFLADVHERELEIAAAEARLHQVEGMHCPHCDFEIEKSFLRCPSCLRRLKEPCGTCGRPLDPRWKICPYCEAEVGQAAPRRTRRAPAAAPAERPSRPRAATAEQPSVTRTRPPTQ
jgi:Double zinc ribbon